MRARRAALAALVLTAFVPRTADAAGCFAAAGVPETRGNWGATAYGSFHCDTARPWLTVEVCLESVGLGADGGSPLVCDTATATGATAVYGSADGCWYGVTLIRSVATGTASTGETATAASPWVPFYCTPI